MSDSIHKYSDESTYPFSFWRDEVRCTDEMMLTSEGIVNEVHKAYESVISAKNDEIERLLEACMHRECRWLIARTNAIAAGGWMLGYCSSRGCKHTKTGKDYCLAVHDAIRGI